MICGDDVIQTDIENMCEEGAREFMADDSVVECEYNCNVSCLDTARYVTAGNSRLVSGHLCFVGKYDTTLWHEKCVNTCVYRKLYTSSSI